jgi:hypothetical protein
MFAYLKMDLALNQFWVWFTFWFLQEPERAAPKTERETNQKPASNVDLASSQLNQCWAGTSFGF